MIRDPSDGSVREKPLDEKAHKSAVTDRSPNENNDLIASTTSGLPLEPTKDREKIEKSRKFLKDYFKRNPEQGT